MTFDAQRMQTIYVEYSPTIFSYLNRAVHNREVAEDLTSQVFVKAVKTLDRTRARTSIRSWLFRAARSVIAEHYRSVYRLRTQSLDTLMLSRWDVAERVNAFDANVSVAVGQTGEQAAAQVRAILAHLPQRHRDVLTLRFLKHQSAAETAEQMHTSTDNLKVLQHRALASARKLGLQATPEDSHSAVACRCVDVRGMRACGGSGVTHDRVVAPAIALIE